MINFAVLIGNLGKDAEVVSFDNQRSKASFPLATEENYRGRNGDWVKQTEWHNVVLWSPIGEGIYNRLKKGKKVYIKGRISTRSYEDKSGATRYITEIVGREVKLLDPRESDEMAPGQSSAQVQDAHGGTVNNALDGNLTTPQAGDLPF